MHYVFDLWVQRWRRTEARGDMVIARYLDDFIVGFENRTDAEQFLSALRERLGQFGLTLHPDKTRLLEFGRYAAQNRWERGQKKPESFQVSGLGPQLWTDQERGIHGASAHRGRSSAKQ